MTMEGLRESQSYSGARSFGQKSDGLRRATRAEMLEVRLPSLTDEFKNALYPPPNPEYTLGVAEGIVFLDNNYLDLYATYEARARGVQKEIHSGMAFHFVSHGAKVQQKSKFGKPYEKLVDVICSKGPDRTQPKTCVPCRCVEQNGAKMYPQDRWGFEVFHAQWYHEQPLMGKDGSVITKKDSNEPIIIRKECLAFKMQNELHRRLDPKKADKDRRHRDCEGCQAGAPFVFGSIRTMKVGRAHLDNILGLDSTVATTCSTCKTKINILSYHCKHCLTMLLDPSTARLTQEELNVYESTACQCSNPGCGRMDTPAPRRVCGFAENRTTYLGGCQATLGDRLSTAVPMSTTDMVFWLQREGSGTNSQVENKAMSALAQSVVPQLPALPNGMAAPGGQKDAPGTPLASVIAALRANPLKLDELYAPVEPADQSALLNIQHRP